MAGGIFSAINNALPTGERSYPVDGAHRIKIKNVMFKKGTAKNNGKEFFIVEGTYVASSEAETNAKCRPGMTVSCAINITAYPDSAYQDIKAFLMAQFSEEELTQVDRSLLQPSEVQPHDPKANSHNPYINGEVGITWAEALQMVAYRGENGIFNGLQVDIEVTPKPNKTKPGTFTKVYWKKAGSIEALGPVTA